MVNINAFTSWANDAILRSTTLQSLPRFHSFLTFVLVIGGPFLAVLTFLSFNAFSASDRILGLILTADLVYVIFVATLVVGRIFQMIVARRAKSAGSRLHLRLTGIFAVLAAVPTVLVAIFAMLTVNQALEGWFSQPVRNAIEVSRSAAEAYKNEQTRGLINDTQNLANALNFERRRSTFLNDGELLVALTRLQPRIQRGLKEAFIINNLGGIRVRGPRSYEFNYERPEITQIEATFNDEVLIIEDLKAREFRALIRLPEFSNHFLYVTRAVDGELLALLDETTQTAVLYQNLATDRGRLVFGFGISYVAFSVLMILAATWLGLWFAERLADPIGKLAAAAQKVGAGNLDERVEVAAGDDEIAMVGRYFNQMTRQLKNQRDSLVASVESADEGRRLFDSVLSSVTSGVVGLDENYQVSFVNKSARRILDFQDTVEQQPIGMAIPEFAAILEKFDSGVMETARDEIKLIRNGKQETLLVRIAARSGTEGEPEGYVIAFEDVSDLVSAQRMAAWGDVARRIAHEVKNPLTPIRLSAERIKRKFGPMLGENSDALENMTDVIVRQTDDLRRIVDEFSKFARTREAQKRRINILPLVKDVLTLYQNTDLDIKFTHIAPKQAIWIMADQTMMSQALNNIVKNATEAISAQQRVNSKLIGEIGISVTLSERAVTIDISDNGIGLPADRERLFEPYVTHRENGTGLGLSIVLKIIEEHNGNLVLISNSASGATAQITLPLHTLNPETSGDQT